MEKIIEKRLFSMVEEDIGFSDLTTSFTPQKKVSANIIAKDAGIASGIYELSILFRIFGIKASPKVRDGAKVKKNQVLYTLQGSSRDILVVERTALNILSRMSGISTLTRAYADKAHEANPKIKVAATRKTTPFFAYFEKKAVKNGGGDTHRYGLGDEVLIKDNHIRLFGSVTEALKTAVKETSFAHKIEIEISRVKDAVPAAASGADVIMLDNMTPEQIKKAAALLEKWGLRKKVLLEASGGINLENVKEYAKSGADVLSIGRLTHSAPALDVSLKIV